MKFISKETKMKNDFTDSEYFDAAYFLAYNAHKGQTDLAGKPYFEHPKRVAAKFNSYIYKTIAILHDVLEDTWITEEMLRKMFPKEIVNAVVFLTRKKDESYKEYIDRMCNSLYVIDDSDYYAREVKIADLEDNMDLTRLEEITDEDLNRVKKYSKWRKVLMEKQEHVNELIKKGLS